MDFPRQRILMRFEDLLPSMSLAAPIIPGRSAAGIEVGCDLRSFVDENSLSRMADDPGNSYLLRFPSVTLWCYGTSIKQIGVNGSYTGKLMEQIGIGTSLAEVEDFFGRPAEEDDEDNLLFPGVHGCCFETSVWEIRGEPVPKTAIFVTDMFVFV